MIIDKSGVLSWAMKSLIPVCTSSETRESSKDSLINSFGPACVRLNCIALPRASGGNITKLARIIGAGQEPAQSVDHTIEIVRPKEKAGTSTIQQLRQATRSGSHDRPAQGHRLQHRPRIRVVKRRKGKYIKTRHQFRHVFSISGEDHFVLNVQLTRQRAQPLFL